MYTEQKEAEGVQGGMEQAWEAEPLTTRRETVVQLRWPLGTHLHTQDTSGLAAT